MSNVDVIARTCNALNEKAYVHDYRRQNTVSDPESLISAWYCRPLQDEFNRSCQRLLAAEYLSLSKRRRNELVSMLKKKKVLISSGKLAEMAGDSFKDLSLDEMNAMAVCIRSLKYGKTA